MQRGTAGGARLSKPPSRETGLLVDQPKSLTQSLTHSRTTSNLYSWKVKGLWKQHTNQGAVGVSTRKMDFTRERGPGGSACSDAGKGQEEKPDFSVGQNTKQET